MLNQINQYCAIIAIEVQVLFIYARPEFSLDYACKLPNCIHIIQNGRCNFMKCGGNPSTGTPFTNIDKLRSEHG